MKHIVGAMGVVLAASFLGCASPRSEARGPNDVLDRMKSELSHSFAQVDTFDAMDDALAHAIGTTTVTSEALLGPMPLPESRMSLAAARSPLQTWGVAEPAEDPQPADMLVSGIDLEIPGARDIPDTRD